jgi:hypothetical protein
MNERKKEDEREERGGLVGVCLPVSCLFFFFCSSHSSFRVFDYREGRCGSLTYHRFLSPAQKSAPDTIPPFPPFLPAASFVVSRSRYGFLVVMPRTRAYIHRYTDVRVVVKRRA